MLPDRRCLGPGGLPGLQNQWTALSVVGGFDSRAPPPTVSPPANRERAAGARPSTHSGSAPDHTGGSGTARVRVPEPDHGDTITDPSSGDDGPAILAAVDRTGVQQGIGGGVVGRPVGTTRIREVRTGRAALDQDVREPRLVVETSSGHRAEGVAGADVSMDGQHPDPSAVRTFDVHTAADAAVLGS